MKRKYFYPIVSIFFLFGLFSCENSTEILDNENTNSTKLSKMTEYYSTGLIRWDIDWGAYSSAPKDMDFRFKSALEMGFSYWYKIKLIGVVYPNNVNSETFCEKSNGYSYTYFTEIKKASEIQETHTSIWWTKPNQLPWGFIPHSYIIEFYKNENGTNLFYTHNGVINLYDPYLRDMFQFYRSEIYSIPRNNQTFGANINVNLNCKILQPDKYKLDIFIRKYVFGEEDQLVYSTGIISTDLAEKQLEEISFSHRFSETGIYLVTYKLTQSRYFNDYCTPVNINYGNYIDSKSIKVQIQNIIAE